jgi:hypothetical protein
LTRFRFPHSHRQNLIVDCSLYLRAVLACKSKDQPCGPWNQHMNSGQLNLPTAEAWEFLLIEAIN